MRAIAMPLRPEIEGRDSWSSSLSRNVLFLLLLLTVASSRVMTAERSCEKHHEESYLVDTEGNYIVDSEANRIIFPPPNSESTKCETAFNIFQKLRDEFKGFEIKYQKLISN